MLFFPTCNVFEMTRSQRGEAGGEVGSDDFISIVKFMSLIKMSLYMKAQMIFHFTNCKNKIFLDIKKKVHEHYSKKSYNTKKGKNVMNVTRPLSCF